jgi:malonyl-CoA O-methyltransferase
LNKNNLQLGKQLTTQLDKNAVVAAFNRAATSYDQAAILQQEVASRLLERLEWIKIQPKIILDLGAGTGQASIALAKKYPDAKIIVLDIAEQMLQLTRDKIQSQTGKGILKQLRDKLTSSKSKQVTYLCADAESIPLAKQSVDLIFSSLAIQWCENTQLLFNELQRILSPSGCLLFSTFGVDTLCELKQSWLSINHDPHVNNFVDILELGDAMLQSGLTDPVMDSEKIVMEYTELFDLFKDLKQIGAHNHLHNRSKGLMTKNKLKTVQAAYEQFKLSNGKYPASYEVVYGHAWGRDLSLDVKHYQGNLNEQTVHVVKRK